MSNRLLFQQHLAHTTAFPMGLEIEKAEGIYLYGPNGEQYIDLISGISVSSLGHSNKNIRNKVKEQVDKYMHTLVYGEFILSPQVELADEILDVLPDTLNNVYLVNSGTEATEGALKLAKRYTGRSKLISCYDSYHGSTNGSLSLMSTPYFTSAFRPLLPQVSFIRFNEMADLDKIDNEVACVVIEPVKAEVGVESADKAFLVALREKCNEHGVLLIFDEIQVGCGRTGSMFAFEHYGVVPDILLLAKAFGGGMPLGAFISSKEIMKSLSDNPILGHITTFGGHPVCCAAALESIRILKTSDLICKVPEKEALFHKLLKHPKIKRVSSAGLLMAVHLSSFDFVYQVIKNCVSKGLITDWFLFNDGALRIAPPLIITEEQIKESCRIIIESIDEV